MSPKKWVIFGIVVVLFLGLAIAGGIWSPAAAQTVPPEEQPTKTPSPYTGGPIALPPGSCVFGPLHPEKTLDLFILAYPPDDKVTRWGGDFNDVASACKEETEYVCRIPVPLLPQRQQLNFYSEGLETRAIFKGEIDPADSCKNKQVYFDLTGYERYMYDKYTKEGKFGFYWFNKDNKTWEECKDLTFEKEKGNYGRLSCNTVKWGYFALGFPAKAPETAKK